MAKRYPFTDYEDIRKLWRSFPDVNGRLAFERVYRNYLDNFLIPVSVMDPDVLFELKDQKDAARTAEATEVIAEIAKEIYEAAARDGLLDEAFRPAEDDPQRPEPERLVE